MLNQHTAPINCNSGKAKPLSEIADVAIQSYLQQTENNKENTTDRCEIHSPYTQNERTTNVGHNKIQEIMMIANATKHLRQTNVPAHTGRQYDGEKPAHRHYADKKPISRKHVPEVMAMINGADFEEWLKVVCPHMTKRQVVKYAKNLKDMICFLDGKMYDDAFITKLDQSAISFGYAKYCRKEHLLFDLALKWMLTNGIIEYADVEYKFFHGDDNTCRKYAYKTWVFDSFNKNPKGRAYSRFFVNTSHEGGEGVKDCKTIKSKGLIEGATGMNNHSSYNCNVMLSQSGEMTEKEYKACVYSLFALQYAHKSSRMAKERSLNNAKLRQIKLLKERQRRAAANGYAVPTQ